MGSGLEVRGRVFDEVAAEYACHRPAYPDALVDHACDVAGLVGGAAVLEIGCGTGQLTRSLLCRGLRVVAVEPGERLLATARGRLSGVGEVQFVHDRFEEASVPRAHYRGVFSASAIQWVDPDVGWHRIADALVDGGTVALLSYFGLEDERTHQDQQAVRNALAQIAPELAGEWPRYRALDELLARAAHRRVNVSETWAWLGNYDVARRYVRDLFEDAQLAAMPIRVEHTAAALGDLLGTMSFWGRLAGGQRDALRAELRALERRLDRPIRASIVACVVTAQRKARRSTS